MSWLCLFTLSCLANPAAPMSVSPEPTEIAVPAAAHIRPGQPSKSLSSALLGCELRQIRRNGAQMVLAVVHAGAPTQGEYEFSVRGQDASHNSVSSSTGDGFQIRAGERLELEGPSLSLRGAALVGRLELRDAQGQLITSCTL